MLDHDERDTALSADLIQQDEVGKRPNTSSRTAAFSDSD